jgi:hypothetical protein
MADTKKDSAMASRMQNFYFEIEDPDGETSTIEDAGEQTGPESERDASK